MPNLVTCPDCENPVSPRAAACPNCGAPISSIVEATEVASHDEKNEDPPVSSQEGQRGGTRTGVKVAIFAVVLGIAAFGVRFLLGEAEGNAALVRILEQGIVGALMVTIVLVPFYLIEWLAERLLPPAFRVGSLTIYDSPGQVARLTMIVLIVLGVGAMWLIFE